MSCGIVQFKSAKLQTSMYPPTESTLKFVPVVDSKSTENGTVTRVSDVGFL